MKTLIPWLVLLASSISAAEVPALRSLGEGAPFCALRFGVAYTDPDRWPEMRAALEKNRGAFDEVWFSTGITFPKLSWHEEHARQCAAAAADLRKLGIVPSIEIQTVIGHGDAFLVKNDCTGQDWRTWVAADGSVAQRCSCPGDPRLAAYFARVAELHAAWKPGSVWVDDDVTLRNRAPMKNPDEALNGCFCDECIKGFEKFGRGRSPSAPRRFEKWWREELAAAIRTNETVAARWEAYQCANFAALTKAIAEAVHRVSPETVLGYQFGGTGRAAIAKGLYDGSGIPVRLRPGGAAYWDSDPYQQINKAYGLQELSATFGYPDWIGARCPEIETCPRTFGCRTPQGVILEAFENLALGMDFLSMFVADARGDETTEFYADTLFPRLAAAHPFLKGYRDANVGTKPVGFTVAEGVPNRLVSSRGIPLIDAYGQPLGVLPPVTNIPARASGALWLAGGMPKDTLTMQVASSVALTNFYAVCDRACGGKLPALFDRAVMCFVVPRVREDGTLVTLGLVNASIDRQEPVGVRLRGVPASVTRAFWHTPEDGSVALAVERRGALGDRPLPAGVSDAWVRLPRLGAWDCGYLSFGR